MTPQEWAGTFAADQDKGAQATCLRIAVEQYFGRRDPELPPLRTADLAEALWPSEHAKDHMPARKRMVDMLLKLAKGPLADHATQSNKSVGMFMGRPRYPWYWHTARMKSDMCPTCGRPN